MKSRSPFSYNALETIPTNLTHKPHTRTPPTHKSYPQQTNQYIYYTLSTNKNIYGTFFVV